MTDKFTLPEITVDRLKNDTTAKTLFSKKILLGYQLPGQSETIQLRPESLACYLD